MALPPKIIFMHSKTWEKNGFAFFHTLIRAFQSYWIDNGKHSAAGRHFLNRHETNGQDPSHKLTLFIHLQINSEAWNLQIHKCIFAEKHTPRKKRDYQTHKWYSSGGRACPKPRTEETEDRSLWHKEAYNRESKGWGCHKGYGCRPMLPQAVQPMITRLFWFVVAHVTTSLYESHE